MIKEFQILEAVYYSKHLITGRIIQRETETRSNCWVTLFVCPGDQGNMSFILSIYEEIVLLRTES